jgi:hypothetical protein
MKLITVLLMSVLSFGVVNANEVEEKNTISQQNLARQPYKKPLEIKSESFEGNVVKDEQVDDKKKKMFNLHQLGRRAYSE